MTKTSRELKLNITQGDFKALYYDTEVLYFMNEKDNLNHHEPLFYITNVPNNLVKKLCKRIFNALTQYANKAQENNNELYSVGERFTRIIEHNLRINPESPKDDLRYMIKLKVSDTKFLAALMSMYTHCTKVPIDVKLNWINNTPDPILEFNGNLSSLYNFLTPLSLETTSERKTIHLERIQSNNIYQVFIPWAFAYAFTRPNDSLVESLEQYFNDPEIRSQVYKLPGNITENYINLLYSSFVQRKTPIYNAPELTLNEIIHYMKNYWVNDEDFDSYQYERFKNNDKTVAHLFENEILPINAATIKILSLSKKDSFNKDFGRMADWFKKPYYWSEGFHDALKQNVFLMYFYSKFGLESTENLYQYLHENNVSWLPQMGYNQTSQNIKNRVNTKEFVDFIEKNRLASLPPNIYMQLFDPNNFNINKEDEKENYY